MCQTAFSVMPSPRILPIFVTRRKILPRSIPAAFIQTRSSSMTQPGTGTIRTCPALPFRSTMAQCSSRCSKCSSFRATASCRRRPQASNSASSARSRLPFRPILSGACQSATLCSELSQLPRRTPRFLTPFTRRIPAADRSSRGQSPLLHRRGAGPHPVEG